MINTKEFDLLLQEIFKIENKIVEVKVLNKFEKANEYEKALEAIRRKAKDIVLDDENKSENFDEISLEVFHELILLHSEIDYYILKLNNIIESVAENKIDAEALAVIKKLWENLEKDIEMWSESNHNPIKEIEHNKHIGKITLDIIIYQLQVEAILDFSKVFKYCKSEFLVNAIKESLFEGAKDEINDQIRRRMLIDLAKNIDDKDLYDYKLWQQILMIKNVRSRDDHIEIIGNFKDANRKYIIDDQVKKDLKYEQNLEVLEDYSLFKSFRRLFSNLNESINQRKMNSNWLTNKGPAFKSEFEDGNIKYSQEKIDANTIENVKKLTIATDGVAKYNFERNSEWKKLEKIEFLEAKNISSVNLSPDKTYSCIGNDSFANCTNLESISFGKIEMIGERAFENCTKLSNITFSKSLMNIGEDAFRGCSNLTNIEFLGELKLYILKRPQNIINCFKETHLEQIIFPNMETAFNFAITDCPYLKRILIANISKISIPFKTCKYRLGRQSGIVSFIGEDALNLWKKRNSNIRFFELTDEDKKRYNMNE